MASNSTPRKITWNWRLEFDEKTLEEGEEFREDHEVSYWSMSGHISGDIRGVRDCSIINIPESYSQCKLYNENQEAYRKYRKRINKNSFYWVSSFGSGCFSCSCRRGSENTHCKHMAALMQEYEERHGPLTFEETPEEVQARLEGEAKREEAQSKGIPLSKLFPATKILPNSYFRMDRFTGKEKVAPSDMKAAGLYLQSSDLVKQVKVAKDSLGRPYLELEYSHNEGKGTIWDVRLVLTRNGWKERSCTCLYTNLQEKEPILCQHLFAGMTAMWNYILKENPGDATDDLGGKLMKAIFEENTTTSLSRNLLRIQLKPRFVWDYDTPRLRFSITAPNGKDYLLKDIPSFISAVRDGSVYSLTPKVSMDFAGAVLSEDSLLWFRMLESQYSPSKAQIRLYNSEEKTSITGSVRQQGLFLCHSVLDVLYDMAGGMTIPCDNFDGEESMIHIGYQKAQLELTLDPLEEDGELLGIKIQGRLPVMLEGATYRYIFTRTSFSRVNAEDLQVLAPYRQLMMEGETFQATIGQKNLSAFFYRSLERLRQDPAVILRDHVSGKVEASMPPKAEFLFLLDIEEDCYTCKATVAYGDDVFSLPVPKEESLSIVRDMALESEALQTAKTYFPKWDMAEGIGRRGISEDSLFDILSCGIADLEKYGEVKASTDFPNARVRPAARPAFRVSIDSGLLDLSLVTKDYSEEELLEILEAYRSKKRYIRLRSGDFIDVEKETPFETLDEMLGGMGLTLEDAIANKAHLPLFRALYVDHLLAKHDELVGSRDRTFRALIKNFKTIRDSDYELPTALEEIMRPYQVYGYKWLRTLAAAGFGGILADEMGLGKTIQMLSAIAGIQAEGERMAHLVVCPASLVYNWKEEASRFTPQLSVVTLAGTLAERRQLLEVAASPEAADLYVISYDTLRNDIAIIQQISFGVVVLDEAQFVKNTKAGVTKAVKVLKAKYRFALTGTPIENRLGELWSIFDFLMPGFLYTEREFQRRFEVPIVKNNEMSLADQLSRMTGPFILRRLKSDVLKELPEKMEEVRTALMEAEQKKLYDAEVITMRRMLEAGPLSSGEDKIKVLAEITRLRELCCDPSLLFENYAHRSGKREACLDLIESAIDGGHRMLLFSQFTSMLALLEEDLKGKGIPYYKIQGSTPKEERLRLVNAFNSDTTPVFLISLRAGGTGLNLIGADMVIHYDPWWNLAVQNQATDRAHRIGQTKQVTVFKLVAAGTIEERIIELQEKKRELADAILTGESNSLMQMSNEELLALLE